MNLTCLYPARLLMTAALLSTSIFSFSQNCDALIGVTSDNTGKKMYSFTTQSVGDGEKSKLLVGGVVDNHVLYLMFNVTGAECYKTGDRITFIFTDKTSVAMRNVFEGGCEKMVTIAFGSTYKNLDTLAILGSKDIATIAFESARKTIVKLKEKSYEDEELRKNISCLSKYIDSDPPIVEPVKGPPTKSYVLKDSTGKEKEVFTVVEQHPEYPGGNDSMLRFIMTNLKYPKEGRMAGHEGTVYVRFVVSVTGALEDITVLRGVAASLNDEALRLVRAMPAWKPGRQHGQPVNVRYVLPIRFSLSQADLVVKRREIH